MNIAQAPFIPLAITIVGVVLGYKCWVLSAENSRLSTSFSDIDRVSKESDNELAKDRSRVEELTGRTENFDTRMKEFTQKETSLRDEVAAAKEKRDTASMELKDQEEYYALLQAENQKLKDESAAKNKEIEDLKLKLEEVNKKKAEDAAKQAVKTEEASKKGHKKLAQRKQNNSAPLAVKMTLKNIKSDTISKPADKNTIQATNAQQPLLNTDQHDITKREALKSEAQAAVQEKDDKANTDPKSVEKDEPTASAKSAEVEKKETPKAEVEVPAIKDPVDDKTSTDDKKN